MALVYIALGSNLNQPHQQLSKACETIRANKNFSHIKVSSFYQSAALIIEGSESQPDYINAVLSSETNLSPGDLLNELQLIENHHGRIRGKQWSARTLDLDILLYDQQQIQREDLTIPHSQISQRHFVLLPLAELSPQLEIPMQGNVSELLQKLALNGISKI